MVSNVSIHLLVNHVIEEKTLNESSPLVGDDIRLIFQIVNYATLGIIVNVFGTMTNIVNIVIFFKLGFSDPVNVSLLGLAISDLGSCSTLIWLNICLNPLFQRLDLPFDPNHIHYLTAGWPHGAFTRVTSLITAFITLERCLCVLFPLKVKDMITPKKVFIVVVSIYLFVLATTVPVFYTAGYSWQYDLHLNRTILRLFFTENRDEIEAISFPIITIFLPIFVFTVVIVCTSLLVITLRKKSKWREGAASQSKSSQLTSRDTRVSKMVILISTVFIVCFFPILILFMTMIVEKEFSIVGRYKNLFYIGFSFSFLLESINSSLNIFIYYTMSSNYLTTFNQLVGRKPSS